MNLNDYLNFNICLSTHLRAVYPCMCFPLYSNFFYINKTEEPSVRRCHESLQLRAWKTARLIPYDIK